MSLVYPYHVSYVLIISFIIFLLCFLLFLLFGPLGPNLMGPIIAEPKYPSPLSFWFFHLTAQSNANPNSLIQTHTKPATQDKAQNISTQQATNSSPTYPKP